MAWIQWKEETGLPGSVSNRTRANLVYDYAVKEAWRLLDGRDCIRLSEQRGFLLISVEDKLLLRFKKYRKGLVTSGIATGQRELFDHQQLTLAGMPPMTNIVAGYELDAFQREIERVAITCRVDGRLIWTIDVPQPDSGIVVPVPSPTEPLPGPNIRSTVRREEESDEAES
jgi:hypothetical protein